MGGDQSDTLSRADGWANVLTGLGQEVTDHRLAGVHRRNRRVSQQEIEGLYEESWLFARIIDAPADHAVRRWLRVTVQDERSAPELPRQILERLEELDAPARMADLLRYDRLDGGCGLLLGADDGRPLDQPLRAERVRRVSHLSILRRHQLTVAAWVADPRSAEYGQPEQYRIHHTIESTQPGPHLQGEVVHASRVIRLVSLPALDYSPYREHGWGVPRIQRLLEPLRYFGSVIAAVEGNLKDVGQGVMKIQGLAQLLATEHGSATLLARFRTMQLAASLFNAVLLDSAEEYEKRPAAAITGMEQVILRAFDLIAAAAEMPLSVLFAQPPGGLSTDDHSAKRNFYDGIAQQQRRLLNRPVGRLLRLLLLEREGPTGGREPAQWSQVWAPLEQPDPAVDSARRKTDADTDAILVDRGIISEQEARSRLLADPECPYDLDPAVDLDDLEPDLREPLLPSPEPEEQEQEPVDGAPEDP